MRKRMTTLAVLLALAITVQGCYGSFALTRRLWRWNGQFNPGAKEAVFLVTGVILPVYSIAALVDAVVLNSIEFWTGKSALAKVVTDGDKKLVMTGDPKTHLVEVSAYTDGKLTGRMFLKETAMGIAAVDPSDPDEVLASARVVSDDQAVLAQVPGSPVQLAQAFQ
jgi:Domain of unknown function (DUF3332)